MASRLSQRVRAGRAAFVALLLAAGGAGCGSARDEARSSPPAQASVPKPSAAGEREAKAAAKELSKHGARLAGPIWPEAVVSVDECDPPVGRATLIECAVGQGVGGEDPIWLRVRVQADGTLTKALGDEEPVPGHKSSERTASLLAADDRLQHAPSRTRAYRCKPSPRLTARGMRDRGSTIGQVCTTYLRVSRTTASRYVEFAPDGTAIRDYVLRDG